MIAYQPPEGLKGAVSATGRYVGADTPARVSVLVGNAGVETSAPRASRQPFSRRSIKPGHRDHPDTRLLVAPRRLAAWHAVAGYLDGAGWRPLPDAVALATNVGDNPIGIKTASTLLNHATRAGWLDQRGPRDRSRRHVRLTPAGRTGTAALPDQVAPPRPFQGSAQP